MVFSVARAFDNVSWSDQDVANELGPNGVTCLTAGDQQTAALLHRTNVVDSVERPPLGSPQPVRAVTHRRFDQPGPRGTQHVSEDSYLLTVGRFEVTLNFQSTGGPIAPAIESSVLSQLAARIATDG